MKEDNLVSLANRPKNERIEIARKGGIKSGESRKNAKNMREVLNMMLSSPTAYQFVEFANFDIPDEDKTHMALACSGIIRAAQQGDVKAFETIMKLTEGNKQ